MRRCPSCKASYEDVERFCSKDGALLETEAEASIARSEASAGAHALVGRDVGSYHLEKVIGQGGMGAVFLARHRMLDKRFALKMLHPSFIRHGALVDRFFREARSASKVRSKNIVQISDFGRTEDGNCYFVMELLDGQDALDKLRSKEPISIGRSVDWVLQACNALAAAHNAGIIHRDIKPANLFICTPGQDGREVLKVLDFGVAKLLDADESITRTGDAIGTPAYMAPEQAEGTMVDNRVDIYGLGAVLYRLVTRTLPFPAPNLATLVKAQLTGTPKPPRELNPDLSESLEAVILRAIDVDRDKRFQTVDELAEALRDADGRGDVSIDIDVSDPSTASASVGEVMSPVALAEIPTERRWAPVVAAAAAAVLALAGGVLWVASGGEAETKTMAADVAAVEPVAAETPAPAPEPSRVRIVSEPVGAEVWRGARRLGVTPMTVEVPAAGLVMELRLAGFAAAPLTLSPDDTERTIALVADAPATVAKGKKGKGKKGAGKKPRPTKPDADGLDRARPTLD